MRAARDNRYTALPIMRNFFEQQEHARRRTVWLAGLFALAVAGVVATIYLAVVGLVIVFTTRAAVTTEPFDPWRADLFGYVVCGVMLVISVGSLFKIRQLAGGGSTIALLMGARYVRPDTTDADERRLMNVVEEMSIASGVAMPHVFLLEDERGINAFAAGFGLDDAVVVVTAGCLKLLTRDELQGVIAHEFSHIFNGDMRLNIRLIGWAHGILCIALLGTLLLRSTPRSGGRNAGRSILFCIVVGALLCVVGYTGVFFARLIKCAVSRQREYLADAAAVQFTRNPAGLASALKKIGGYELGSQLRSVETESVSHLLFANGLKRAGLLSTHPPLVERIRRLDPQFDGRVPRIAVDSSHRAVELEQDHAAARLASAAVLERTTIDPADIVARVGRPDADAILAGRTLMSTIPSELRRATHEPFGAVAVVYGLLLSDDPPEQQREQLEALERHVAPTVAAETRRLLPAFAGLDPRLRLPLVDLAIPSLRNLAVSQYREFARAVQGLVRADRRLSLFEFALTQIVLRRLSPMYGRADRPAPQFYAIGPLMGEARTLLSALAWAGGGAADAADAMFARGAERLGRAPAAADGLRAREACSLENLRAALDRLNQSAPAVKAKVLDAAAHVVLADRIVSLREAELLRAVAESLDCPLPPFLAASTGPTRDAPR